MTHITELGFKERIKKEGNDCQGSLYTHEGLLVAWFRRCVRQSAGENVVNASTQLIERSDLSEEQLLAAKAWLTQHV
jgi:hypothetical protein